MTPWHPADGAFKRVDLLIPGDPDKRRNDVDTYLWFTPVGAHTIILAEAYSHVKGLKL